MTIATGCGEPELLVRMPVEMDAAVDLRLEASLVLVRLAHVPRERVAVLRAAGELMVHGQRRIELNVGDFVLGVVLEYGRGRGQRRLLATGAARLASKVDEFDDAVLAARDQYVRLVRMEVDLVDRALVELGREVERYVALANSELVQLSVRAARHDQALYIDSAIRNITC